MYGEYELSDFPPLTGYQQVQCGGIRNGWRLAIPIQNLYKNFYGSPIYYCPPNSWTTDHPDEAADWPPRFSADFLLRYPSPDGNYIYSIRRHSLIQPNASTALVKAVVPPSWLNYGMFYISSRIIMLLFGQPISNRWRLILVDAMARSNRVFMIQKPDNDVSASLGYVANGHLHIVFDKHVYSMGLGWRLESIDAKYDLTVSAKGPFIRPTSWESISFPVGHRLRYAFKSGIPMVNMAFDLSDLGNGDNHLCFTFDHDKKWRLESLTKWLDSYTKTKRGSKVMNAAKALADLLPPASWIWFRVPAVREFNCLFTVPASNELICVTDFDGILRRWINPPSLMRLAAEAFFRAHPGVKISDVEEATGVRISDRIPEDGTEGEIDVVDCQRAGSPLIDGNDPDIPPCGMM